MIFFLVLFFITPLISAAEDGEAKNLLEKYLSTTNQYSVICKSIEFEKSDVDGWEQFAIREIHEDSCGGDPYTSPITDRYRVNPDNGEIQLWNPAVNIYESVHSD